MSVCHCHHSKTCWDLFSTITFSLTWLPPLFAPGSSSPTFNLSTSHICINCSPYFFLGPTADSHSKVVHYNTVGFHLTTSAVKPFVVPDYYLLMWCASVIHQYQYNVDRSQSFSISYLTVKLARLEKGQYNMTKENMLKVVCEKYYAGIW